MPHNRHYFDKATSYVKRATTDPLQRDKYLEKALYYYQLVGGKSHCIPTDPPVFTPVGTKSEVGSPQRCRNKIGESSSQTKPSIVLWKV
jgi:hypothetical protein